MPHMPYDRPHDYLPLNIWPSRKKNVSFEALGGILGTRNVTDNSGGFGIEKNLVCWLLLVELVRLPGKGKVREDQTQGQGTEIGA